VTVPFLFGILHRHLGAPEKHILEVLKRDRQTGGNSWQIQSLAPVKFCRGTVMVMTNLPLPLQLRLNSHHICLNLQQSGNLTDPAF